MDKHFRVGLLFLIVLLAFCLRLYQIDTESLWKDEAYSYHHAQQDIPALVSGVIETEAAPPGYYILQHFWNQLFGESVFYMRLFSAILGIASVILVYLLAKVLFNPTVGLISSFLMSTSMLQVLYSQQLRLYALFSFLALLTTLFMAYYLRKGKKSYLLLYIASGTIAFYVHYFVVFLFMFQLIYIYFKHHRELKNILFSQGVMLLFFVPWIPTFMSQLFSAHARLQFALAGKGFPVLISSLGIFLLVIPLLTATVLFYISLNNKLKKISENGRLSIACVFLIGVMIIQLVFRDKLITSFAPVRYLLFSFPIFYILAGEAYWLLGGIKNHGKKLAVIFLAVFMVFNLAMLYEYYYNSSNSPWDETADYLDINSGENPTILFDKSGFPSRTIFDYYFSKCYQRIELTWIDADELSYQRLENQELVAKISDKPEFWLVQYTSPDKNYYPQLFGNSYEIKDERLFKDITIYHYHQKSIVS